MILSLGDIAHVAADNLEHAANKAAAGEYDKATAHALVSLACSLYRIQATPFLRETTLRYGVDSDQDPRLETIERQLIALANSVREVFARLDRLDEEIAQLAGSER